MKERLKRNKLIAATAGVIIFAHIASFGYLALVGWTVLFIIVSSRSLVSYWIAHLAVRRSFTLRRGRIGDSATGKLTIRNTGKLPVPFLIARDYIDRGTKVEGARSALGMLLPSREMELNYRLIFERRGYYQVGPACIETGDLFGLYKRFRSAGGANHVLIYPKTLVLSRYDIASRRPVGEVRITSRLFEDPLLVSTVRDYQPGDPLRNIHWKATAHKGALMTKMFEPTTVIGATIVLDFDRAAYTEGSVGVARSELAVTLTASIAYHIYSKRQKVGLLSNAADAADRMTFDFRESEDAERIPSLAHGRPAGSAGLPTGMHIPTRRSEEQATRILEALARAELSEGFVLEDLLGMYSSRLPRNASLIVITERVDERRAGVLQGLKDGGFAVRALCVSDPEGYRASLAALAAVGVDCQLIADEEDMNEIAIRGI